MCQSVRHVSEDTTLRLSLPFQLGAQASREIEEAIASQQD